MDTNFTNDFRVDGKFSIKKASTSYKGKLTKEEDTELLIKEKEKLRELQERLYADGSQFCWLCFRQWMPQEKTA